MGSQRVRHDWMTEQQSMWSPTNVHAGERQWEGGPLCQRDSRTAIPIERTAVWRPSIYWLTSQEWIRSWAKGIEVVKQWPLSPWLSYLLIILISFFKTLWHSVMTYTGKESKRVDICITDSLCTTAETNTTLKIRELAGGREVRVTTSFILLPMNSSYEKNFLLLYIFL